MKLTDFLQDVGRPVAYYPELRKITGSTNATILLCQFIYWRGKESDPNGWLFKQSEEIESETGLSYDEQVTARKKLIEAGLLEEHYARLDHTMRFRLLLDAIDEKWGNEQSHIRESRNTGMGKAAKPVSLNESEITAENTSQTDRFKIIANSLAILQGGSLKSTDADLISAWLEKHTNEWITKAVQIANDKGAKSGTYVDKILIGWEANGYPKTREQAVEERKTQQFKSEIIPQEIGT